MKQHFVCLLACFYLFNFNAQDKTIKVESDYQQITVYLNGAEIKRSANIGLKAGKNKISMINLSNSLEPSSVQVGIGNDVQMLGIASQNDFLSAEELVPRIKTIKDSLQIVQRELKTIDNTLEGYHTEKTMLIQNQKIVGSNATVTVAELDKATTFFRKRIWEINEGKTQLEWDRSDLQEEQYKLQRQLNELNAQTNPSRKVVNIELDSPRAQNVEIRLRYLVSNAGWAPAYDIVAGDIEKGIDFKYNGKVYNNTGLDWNEVQLILSTADPYECATAPVLTPWNLNFNRSRVPELIQGNVYDGLGRENMKVPSLTSEPNSQSGLLIERNDNFQEELFIPSEGGQSMMVSLPELSAEFEIEKLYSIPADRKSYLVKINEFDLDAQFEHFAVPKMDKDAFLIAKLSSWQKLDLIDGPANIYYGDTYVGESIINTRNTNDTIDISLGRDKQVLITRVKKEDFTKNKSLGAKRKERFEFEITLKNNRNIPVVVAMKDQIPVSQVDDIEVTSLEISGGKLEEDNGIITWDVELNPGQSKKYVLAFEVKYPKNKKVALERRKVMNARWY
ncbi:MAG: DUF4139 domain-containing protein [Bacteroidota bacterium]